MKIGCDIVKVSRIRLDDAFVDGILSPNEKTIFAERKNKKEFVAGRFAAKEAFLKALGTGLVGIRLPSIEVLYRPGGAPYLLYQGKEYEVSISHEKGYAISVALIA